MNTLEKIVQSMFDTIERTALDSDGIALQGGRIYFNGDFDAMVVARALLEALLEPSEGMIDAPRGLIMYFNSPPGESYPLGRHAKSGGYGERYAHLLTDREKRMHSFPKAHQASLVFRAMIQAALEGK